MIISAAESKQAWKNYLQEIKEKRTPIPFKPKDLYSMEEEKRDQLVEIILSDDEIFKQFIGNLNHLIDIQNNFPQYADRFLEKFTAPQNFLHYISSADQLTNFRDNTKFPEDVLKKIFCDSLRVKYANSVCYLIGGMTPIIKFVEDTSDFYYKNVDRLTIAFQMVEAALKPQRINQHDTGLCGISVVLGLWLKDNPIECLNAFIQLLKKGVCESPLPLKASHWSRDNDNDFSDIFLSAIKNASNIFGYSPIFFEKYRATTEPGAVCNLLIQCGYKELKEATILTTRDNKALPWYYHLLDRNLYAKNHLTYKDKEENFKELLSEYANRRRNIILYINFTLAKTIQYKKERKEDETYIFGVSENHYVLLEDINQVGNKKVALSIYTWGNEYFATIDEDFFIENYYGFISTESKFYTNLKNHLSNNNNNNP